MDPLSIAGLSVMAALLGALILGVHREIQRTIDERARRWRIAAEFCGLTDIEESRASGKVEDLRGRFGPWRVLFTAYQRQDSFSGTKVVIDRVDGQADLPWLTLRPPRPGLAFEGRLRHAREVEVGDPALDDQLFVDGEAALVRAALDAETRRLLFWLLMDVRLELINGQLRTEPPQTRHEGADLLTRVVPRLLELAERLTRPTDVARRLAHNALRDPLARIRLENLLLLAREFPKDPVTRQTQVEASRDPDDEVRLRAAMGLGEEGRDALLALAASGPDSHGARAVAVLERHCDPERLRAILEASLHAPRRLQTALACLSALGRSGARQAVDPLARVMAVEKGELAVAAAHALGRSRLATAEPPLLDALERAEAPDLRLAAAEALGRCATIKAVAALKEAEARHPYDGTLQRAARQAVAEIQARATGASPGQLSLAAGETGQLTLDGEDAIGRLSLPEEHEASRHGRRQG